MRLETKIEQQTARLAIVGQGYVGLPLAVEFARTGFRVTGIDTDRDRVEALSRGDSYGPDVPQGQLQEVIRMGRFVATTDTGSLADQDVVLICVPTPLRKSKDPDISYVVAAAEEVARHFRTDQLVVLESTTYPGTTQEVLLPMLEQGKKRVGEDFYLAFSPERINPGDPARKVKNIPKLVAGVTPACTRMAALLYRKIVAQVFELSNPKVAELAKLYENLFRSVNIALANELALICRHLGVSVWDVINAAATKPFGFMPFYPGPGIGGHCIPVDPLYLSWKARLNGYEARFINLANEINQTMPRFVLGLLSDALNKRGKAIDNARILVLGVSYKRGVGDTRESPALEILTTLAEQGAHVSYSDPYVPSVALDGVTLKAVPLNEREIAGADCVLILTDHPEFDYRRIVELSRLVIDTRNATSGIPAPKDRVITL